MTNNHNQSASPFLRRALIVIGLIAALAILVYLVLNLAQTLLVLFAGILLAVFLDGLTRVMMKQTPLPHGVALALVTLLLFAAIFGLSYFAGPRIGEQFERLTTRIPQAVEQIKNSLSQYDWGQRIVERAPSISDVLPFGRQQLISAPAAFSSAFGVLVNAIIILFIGIYLAVSPGTYIHAAMKLLPPHRRDRGREVARTIGGVLRRWFIGRFSSMLVVGILTALGLWIAGIPLAFVLGLIAGLLSFVPFIGPLVSAIPALLVALAESPLQAFWVIVIYSIVQTFESYLITPLIQRVAVSIPPAGLITAQIIMGALFGIIGVFLATPLAVIIIVAIQMLYIQDILHDDVRILGH